MPRPRLLLAVLAATGLLVGCGAGPTDTVAQQDASRITGPTDAPRASAGPTDEALTSTPRATEARTETAPSADPTSSSGGVAPNPGAPGPASTGRPPSRVVPTPGPAIPSRLPGQTVTPTGAPTPTATSSVVPGGVGWERFAFDPDRHTYTVTHHRIRFTVTVDDLQPKAGAPVRFTLTSHSGALGCCVLHVDYADGGTDSKARGRECGTVAAEDNALATEHVWNRAGTYVVSFQAGPLCDIESSPDALMQIVVKVADGRPPVTNGPALPTATLAYSATPDGAGGIAVAGQGRDEDGYVRSFDVDWGDGTRSESHAALGFGACTPGPSGLSGPSYGFLHDGAHVRTHRYAARGNYVVTLTVRSTDCAGAFEQTGTATMATGW